MKIVKPEPVPDESSSSSFDQGVTNRRKWFYLLWLLIPIAILILIIWMIFASVKSTKPIACNGMFWDTSEHESEMFYKHIINYENTYIPFTVCHSTREKLGDDIPVFEIAKEGPDG